MVNPPNVNINPNIIGTILTPHLFGMLAKVFITLFIVGALLYWVYKVFVR